MGRNTSGKQIGKPIGVIVALSYCWRSPSHPDPDGELVEEIARMLHLHKQFWLKKGWDNPIIGVFWDWASLYQRPRSAAQEQIFVQSLFAVNLWYAHQLTIKWLATQLPLGCER